MENNKRLEEINKEIRNQKKLVKKGVKYNIYVYILYLVYLLILDYIYKNMTPPHRIDEFTGLFLSITIVAGCYAYLFIQELIISIQGLKSLLKESCEIKQRLVKNVVR